MTKKTADTSNVSFSLTDEMRTALAAVHGQTGSNVTAIVEFALRMRAGKNGLPPTSPTKAKRGSSYGLHLSETSKHNLRVIAERDGLSGSEAIADAVKKLAEALT